MRWAWHMVLAVLAGPIGLHGWVGLPTHSHAVGASNMGVGDIPPRSRAAMIIAAVDESTRGALEPATGRCKCDVVEDYHAVGDGFVDDTAALQRAFDECGRSSPNECKVRVVILRSSHTFLSFPLVLSDALRVEIHKNSTLRANTRHGWPLREEPMYGLMYQHFLSGRNLSSVSLTGGGVIDGQANYSPESWWYNCTDSHGGGEPHCGVHHRPFLVHMYDSSGIVLSNITLTNAPMYHVVLDHSRYVRLDHVSVFAPPGSPNTDGVDVHSSEWVHVHNCTICNGDDAVAVATYDPKVRSGYVLVEWSTFCNGSHGASIGSRDLGGVHNVTIQNVHFVGTQNAARVKAVAGEAGSVTDILYENISATNVGHVLIIDALYSYSEQHLHQASAQRLPTTTFTGDLGVALPASKAGAPLFSGKVDTAAAPEAAISRVTFLNVIGKNVSAAGYFRCQPTAPCTAIKLQQIDISVSSGHKAEFECESAHGTAAHIRPRSCLLPDAK